MERRRVGDRVQPVEGVREVDEAALRRIAATVSPNDMPARDLLGQEEADHLALAVGLDLLAGDHDQVPAAGELDGLERAAEDVVVGDGDRAEALRPPRGRAGPPPGRAVARPGGVQVEVGEDPVPVGERVAGASGCRRRAEAP